MSERACTSCGTANESDARFCEGCGTALERTCGACGVVANATARFCRSCGASLDVKADTAKEGPTRKTVTVMFADLAGSTAFEEAVDAETAREVVGQYHDLLRSTAERHRVGVTKYIGDGFMAVWGVPEVGADDAEHAVDAAVELQERFVGLADEVADTHGVQLALRVAVNTGEVVVGADDADLVGDALNVGARLESECPHGHVVVGEETWRSTRGRHRYDPLGGVQVKGRTAPVPVYQWLGHRTETADSIPFVGRSDELGRLQRVFDDAVASRTARLVTVIGDPGVGKTRLAAEFVASLDGARVIRARCAVEASPALVPLAELLRTRDLDADIRADVPERDRILRDLTGMSAGVAGSVEETFWALRRFVEVLASDRPVVIVVDDIHWADTLLIDFIEHLAEWVQDSPVLLVALARSELREIRPDLVTVGGWVSEALRLRGLEAHATAELAARVLGSDDLPTELLGRLPLSTGGNPLFVRELVGMLVHDGVLIATPNGWRLTVDVDAIAVPPTIQALLASRLERLNLADRRVLEVASVVGNDFSPSAVAGLAGLGSAEITSALNRLRRLDFAQPSGTYAGDEPVWRFHHVLVRDVAYRRLLKSDRADLHERLADRVQGEGAGVAFESDEVIARHLETAHGYRLDLGLRDEHTGELAVRSAQNYLASARRALDRDELVSAGTQAARGAALAATDSALRAELLLVGCEAFLSAGDVATGAPLIDDLERIAGEALGPWAICYRCQLVVYTDPTRLLEVDERLQDAIDEFARRKDPGGLAKAHRVRANVRARLGRVGACEIDLFEALIAARQGGDHRQITAALGAAPNAALWGPSPAPKAGGRCLDVVRMQRMTTAAPSLEATSLRCLAVLELLRGRPDKARSMLADARQVVADLGLRHGLMETELFAGIIELMVGDPVAAEPHFRTALEGLDALGVGVDAGQAAALLAKSVLAQGRIDEADRYAAQSERIAGHNLKTAIAWRAVRAEILSAQGEHEAAVTRAREAVTVASDTDLILDHADACLVLSRVLAAAGDDGAADKAHEQAESLYATKDAVFMARLTAESAASPPSASGSMASRLLVQNRASDIIETGWREMKLSYADDFTYDDRRKLKGEPIVGSTEFRTAMQRKLEQYPHVEAHRLAVRGETLALISLHWSDEAGNRTASLDVFEVDDGALLTYHGRFDEDNFEGAYRELESRYYAGEGSAFSANGHRIAAFLEAMDRLDLDAARNLSVPEFRWIAPPSALTPSKRTLDDLFRWLQERAEQVASSRNWAAAIHWLSPNCYVAFGNTVAAGSEGEDYQWSRLYVGAFRDELLVSVHQFEHDDEDAALAYTESLTAQRPSRLVVANAASRVAQQVFDAMRAEDVTAVTELSSKDLIYDDRRRIAGGLIADVDHLRSAVAEVLALYRHFEIRTLAVRGERLCLSWTRWSDDPGNAAVNLHVTQLGEDGLVVYEGFFDEDDFVTAYLELEARYYAGEGAQFATHGLAMNRWLEAVGRRDLAALRALSHSDFRWFAPPTALKATERTVDDMVEWMDERGRQVSSLRYWVPRLRWLSPDCAVGLGAICAAGADDEAYDWNFISVAEYRDGLLVRVREFDDEDEAFTFAEALVAPKPSRLSLQNGPSKAADRLIAALRVGDLDTVAQTYADRFAHADHRRISGGPVTDRTSVRAAFERIAQLYNQFEIRTLAVRGERLHLAHYRWSDDSGNQSVGFVLSENDADGRIAFQDRFDEDDFEAAYIDLERRYYAGEGAPYAEAGAALTRLILAESRGDLDDTFSMFSTPGLRIESRSRSLFPSRNAEELRHSVEELGTMVASYRIWGPAICWLSREWMVGRHSREAIGRDGEKYEWARIYVAQIKDGLFTSLCEFDIDDEDAAFAYAEERMRAAASRLTLTNRASAAAESLLHAMRSHDEEAALAVVSDDICFHDHRRLSGDPIHGKADARAAITRILQQFNRFELRMLAVRGETLAFYRSRWFDDSGNETTYLHVTEVGDDGRIVTDARFDEDDFDGAYRELDRRYYASEGAEFAASGRKLTIFLEAMDAVDVEAARRACLPGFRWFTPPSTFAAQERSLDEFFQWLRERAAQVTSVKNYGSVVRWLSPTCFTALGDVRATGADGEQYTWARAYVGEFRDGLLASMRQFDDEESAFACAENLVRSSETRLATTNRASDFAQRLTSALRAGDVEGILSLCSDECAIDDRRRLAANTANHASDPNLLRGQESLRAAIEELLGQFDTFDMSALAIRGERLALCVGRWSDDSGNDSTHQFVFELCDDGQLACLVYFDDDDFQGAYRELETRYYAGDGAVFAEPGMAMAEYISVKNAGDLDTLFGDMSTPDVHIESRSRSVFMDRSAAEYRASLEELNKLVDSVREWLAVIEWLSPAWFMALLRREAVGAGGEQYEWTRVVVGEVRSGRFASACQFETDDEDAAFAYAEELARQS